MRQLLLDRRRPVSPTSKSLLFCLHAGFDARPLPKPFAIPKRQHPRRCPKTGQSLWRGDLSPLGCAAVLKAEQLGVSDRLSWLVWGAAAQPNGDKSPRHRDVVALSDSHCPTPGHNGCRFGITGNRFLPQDSLARRSNSAGHRTIKIPKRRKISACSSLVSLSNGGSRS